MSGNYTSAQTQNNDARLSPSRSPKAHQKAGGKFDLRQTITDKIISILESGVGEWRKTWNTVGKRGFPKNGKTGDVYHGINVMLLSAECLKAGYSSNIWLTYKQAESIGAQVRKGAKGTMCAYFELIEKAPKECVHENAEDDKDKNSYLLCKPFWLFNIAQIDGLPENLCKVETNEPIPKFKPIETAEHLLNSSGAIIAHGYNEPFYSSHNDEIRLPVKEQFECPEAYYETALHELSHWTGHGSRLNRQFGKRFGDDATAFEELVAELGSAFLCGYVGIDSTYENNAAYLSSWLTILKKDKTAIFTASKHAGEAYEFILGRAGKVAC
jgi:antirestriction protein ArdC